MNKETLLYSIIELIILLIPIVTLIFRYSAWKKEVDMKIDYLQKENAKQEAYYIQITQQLSNICNVLTKLETKLDFMEDAVNEQKKKLATS